MNKMNKLNNRSAIKKIEEKGAGKMGVFKCFECGEKDFYEFREVEREYVGEGYNFTMKVNIPFCKKCGAPITNENLENEIAEKANKRIRESRGIIQREEILEILSKYNVSQKFLSRMLGWGEITLTRYINKNYTPNLANSEKLKSLNDPYILNQILDEKIEESGESILEDTAFIKLRDNVLKQIEEIEKKEGKIFQVVNWFLAQSTEENRLTHLGLQKLLYFSQAWNYVLNNEWLFSDDCEAWVHGAVYHNVYDEFKKFKYKPLPYVSKKVELSKKEVEVLEYVKKYYFDVYTAKTLEKICHLEEPYKNIRKEYDKYERCETIIEKKHIQDYYVKIAKRYNISKVSISNLKTYLNELLAKECEV